MEAGEWDDQIKCRLEVTNINAPRELAREFEAISYVWGATEKGPKGGDSLSTDSPTILVDHKDFTIGANLQAALRHFRRRPATHHGIEPRALWADAICINQDDVDERNHQVSVMGKIYHNCQRVLIWLGEVTSNGAITTLENNG